MSKEQENLRDKFEEETNLKCWSEPHFEDVGFSDKYVEWLEKQLLLCNVVGRSEQCAHPRDKREYIGSNMLRCKICGKEFS